MEYSFKELEAKRVADLRKIAAETHHEAVKGYSTMHKDQLLGALCTALGIAHHKEDPVVETPTGQMKARIRELKAKRDAALQAHDPAELKRVRRKIHRLKRRIRAARR